MDGVSILLVSFLHVTANFTHDTFFSSCRASFGRKREKKVSEEESGKGERKRNKIDTIPYRSQFFYFLLSFLSFRAASRAIGKEKRKKIGMKEKRNE